jgi:hypothetical protein
MTNNPIVRYLLQAFNLALFMWLIASFSAGPTVRQLEEGMAVVTLAFGHAGQPVRDCRMRTPEELEALAPNMRAPMDCPRERSTLRIELIMDGKLIHNLVAPPPGAYKDQGVDIYENVTVPIGNHTFTVRMKDSDQSDDFTYSNDYTVELTNAQLLFIDFSQQENGFIFH